MQTEQNERRAYARFAPRDRAAVWFNIGLEIGELSKLTDISMAGFSVQCDEWQLPVFLATEGRLLNCVLLLEEAHFGCMVSMVSAPPEHNGHVGFQFEAIPAENIRLVEGLISGMRSRQSEQTSWL